MKYVIWGAGVYGHLLIEVLGEENVVAFIDNNERLHNNKIKGKMIIGFSTYLKRYSEYLIIISPKNRKDIIEILERNKVYQYFSLFDSPPEILDRMVMHSFFDEFPVPFDRKKVNGIYGITLFSLFVYSFLKKEGCNDLYLIPEISMTQERKNALTSRLKNYNISMISEVEDRLHFLFLTIKRERELLKRKNKFKKIDFFDFSNRLSIYHNKNLEKFRDIHKGNRIFIIATGPSLKLEDLEILRKYHEICMGMNQIYCIFSKIRWRPDYYVIQDRTAIKSFKEAIKNLDVKNKFVADVVRDFWDDEREQCGIYRYHCHFSGYYPDFPDFSDDFSKRVYEGCTVTYACIQIAVYMGANEIYLLGVDFDYTNQKKHFSDDYYFSKNISTSYDYENTYRAYLAAKKYADTHGIKIYNATRGGKLDVFDRVEFDAIFDMGK